ncbi:hypothetical protein [Clostridium sp. LP20]|uniref:hypothetical protein n=1 Tax=Clostridium sp. LP20 TaxID=3418665 RepID=UPI003EE5B00E
MKKYELKPEIVIEDLKKYLGLFELALSEEGERILLEIESFSYKCDNPSSYNLFLSKSIRGLNKVHEILKDKGVNPILAAVILEKDYYSGVDKSRSYQEGTVLYSNEYKREDNENTSIIDRAMEYCVADERDTIEVSDILLSTIDECERILVQDAGLWNDKKLNRSYITLAHVYGKYNKELWIKFDDIREGLLIGENRSNGIKIA